MSYILDALKKSDRERQRGNIPSLNSIHDPSPASSGNHFPNQRTKYITIIGLILIITAAAMTWYRSKYLPNTDTPVIIEQTRTITEPEKNNPSTHSAESPVTESPVTESPVTESPVTESPVTESPVTEPAPSAEDNRTNLPSPPTITTRSKKIRLLPDQTTQPEEKEEPVSLPPQEHPVIPNIKDLPSSIRTAIPDLQLAGHTYSDTPTKRMIIINGNILREGDRVNDSIRLIEITWTGVILDRNGNQFTVEIE
jgi:general secretion pathway protein B